MRLPYFRSFCFKKMAQILSELGSDPKVNDYLKSIAEDLENNPPEDTNGGHNALMNDLAELTKEAYDYHFHDFRGKYYVAPKVTLRGKLLDLARNVEKGKYDN